MEMAKQSPILASFLHTTILNRVRFEDALSYRLAQKLGSDALTPLNLREVFDQALTQSKEIGQSARADIVAVYNRDPACKMFAQPFLYFKGYHALQSYRIAHWLWETDEEPMALFLQNRISEVFGVDIHPAAQIGKGVMFDHATGIVIGETAVVEDDVSMLHEVTLGGTGKEDGDRHPKVRRGVLLSVGAKVLGNIEIGECSRVAAGSVVLHDVPARKTVAGVPARIVGDAKCNESPSHDMDHAWPDNAADSD
ncbi:MAG: serine O-acetyltransferase [Alphaproteobacteria bacterium]|nr:MAG: serine O-acetyltransferase [Alphaproteobacteria bacterium]